jgi:hypothetical protein
MTTETTLTPGAPSAPPSVTPNVAATARAKLDGLTSNAEWAGKYLAGDVAARHEFADLTAAIAAGDDVSAAINGTATAPPAMETVFDGQLPSRATADVVNLLRENGLSDGAIGEAFNGAKISREVAEQARQLQRMRHGDRDWVAQLLSGDHAARREQLLLSIVLSGEISDRAK